MDNYYIAIQELSSWGKDELFYRGYYQAVQKSQEELFLQVSEADPEWIDQVKNPENIHVTETEDMFISADRNVAIIKHPRYFPVFFHSHHFFEIVYVLTGSCEQIMDHQTLHLNTGDYCMIAPEVRHGIQVFDDNSIIVNILIRKSTFMDIFLNTIRNKSQIGAFFMGNIYGKNRIEYMIFHTGQDEELRNYVLQMYLEQICADDYSDRIICSILTIFFNMLTRKHGKTVETQKSNIKYDGIRSEMLNYLMNHFDTASIKSLADQFHFSEPYCSKLVKELTGYTFSDLLNSLRMQQGEMFLTQTQMSVENISDRLGYKNPETFIRAFKKTYGLSPSQFRKSQ